MATKVGEAYVEIYPNINRALRERVIANIAKDMRKIYNDAGNEEVASTQRTVNRTANVRKRGEQDTRRELNRTRNLFVRFWKDEENNNKKTEGFFHRLATHFRTIGTLTRGFAIGVAVLSTWGALQAIVGAVVAAMPIILASLAAMPYAITAVTAGAVTLGFAFHGVFRAIRDAFNPAQAKQFAEEIKSLAPAARSFVQELAKLKDLKGLPNLQQTFFSSKGIQQTAKNLPSFVQKAAPGANSVVGAQGNFIGGITSTLTGGNASSTLKEVFRTISTGLKNSTPGVTRLTDGFLDLTRHVAQFLGPKAGKGFGDWLASVGRFFTNVDVAKLFHKAADAARGFARVGRDLGTVFKGIFEALGGSGTADKFFSQKGLGGILHTMAQFVNSGTGKRFLEEVGGGLTALSQASAGIIGDGLKIVAQAFHEMAPVIKPVAEQLKKIAADLVPLGPVVGALGGAFLQVALVILSALEPSLKLVVDLLAKIPKPVLIGIATGFIAIWGAFKLFYGVREIVKGIKEWIALQWGLNIAMSANPITLIVIGIAALVVAIVYIATKTRWFQIAWEKSWGAIKTAWNAAYKFLTSGWTQFIPLIFGAVGAIVFLAFHWKQALHYILVAWDATWKALVIAFRSVKDFFTRLIPGWALKFRDWIVYAYNSVVNNTHKWWSAVANFFTGRVRGFFVKTIPGWLLKLRDWFVYFFDKIFGVVRGWWGAVSGFFTGKVKGFFTKTIPGWLGTLRDWFKNRYDDIKKRTSGFVDGIFKIFNRFKDFFTKTIPGWAGTLKSKVLGIWDSLKNWTADKWIKLYNSIRDAAQTVIDRAWTGGIAKAWNWLADKIPKFGDKLQLPKILIPRWGHFAVGGPISGPGGPTSDQVPAWLSNGEYVIRTSMVKKHRDLIEAINEDKLPRYASGGAVGAIEALQRSVGPSLRVTSTTGGRHAKNSYHYRGLAVDFAGSRRAMDAAAANLMKFSGYILELIHSPNWFVKNYRKVGRGTYASVYNDHFNHVHLAMTKAAADAALRDKKSGKIRGFVGFGPGGRALDPWLARLHQEGALKQFINSGAYKGLPGNNVWHTRDIGKEGINRSVTSANKIIDQLYQEAISYQNQLGATNLGRLSGAIGSWIGSASKYSNIPSSWVPLLRTIIARESGGNPRAVNRTDINAQRGIPSSGLMQLIPPNFKKYHASGTSWDIFDPVANIAAGINYIHAKYGTIFNTPWGKGTGTYYSKGGPVLLRDGGGPIPPGFSTVYNGTGTYEHILNREQFQGLGHCMVKVFLDGVDVTSRAHVETSNQKLINALNSRGGHRP